MTQVMACIDGSASALAVCDYAAWASQRLAAPLTLLHVLDQQRYPSAGDLSGNIGLGSREHLLQELAALDEKRGRLALEEGRVMLEAGQLRASQTGVAAEVRQRHGDLVETVHELEHDIRLLVLGRQAEVSGSLGKQIGSHLESVARTLHRPILVVPTAFKPPQSAMLAFDGSPTTLKSIEVLAHSLLFRDMPVHVVMVGTSSHEHRAQLAAAHSSLHAAGLDVQTQLLDGDIEPTLHAYQAQHSIDLLVMGAYGHSRIREFLIGSTTNAMLRTSTSPLLLLR